MTNRTYIKIFAKPSELILLEEKLSLLPNQRRSPYVQALAKKAMKQGLTEVEPKTKSVYVNGSLVITLTKKLKKEIQQYCNEKVGNRLMSRWFIKLILDDVEVIEKYTKKYPGLV